MEHGSTALRERSAPRRPGLPGRRRSQLPHHRRRRAVAGASLAALALVMLLVLSGGGSSPVRAHHAPPSPFFSRLAVLAGGGPGSFAVAEQAAENAAITRTLAYTPYVRIAGAQHREVALTFDDGPGPYTPQILSVLERYGVPATFFEVGVMERYFHASTTEMVARGYPIGDHTEGHLPLGTLSMRDQRQQLLQQIGATGAYGAAFPRMFRPPYGSWNHNTLRLLAKLKMLMVLWSVDTNDYRRPGVAAIVHAAVAGARPGAILLLHDAGGDRSQTVAALPEIIAALRARGYAMVTVPKLLLDNPAPADQDISAVLGSGG